MRERSWLLSLLVFTALISNTLGATEITAGSNDPPQIVERGQSPSGCSDKKSKRRLPLPGRWLALTPTEIRNSKPYVILNSVSSSKSDERYFVAGLPLKAGAIQTTTLQPRPSKSTARTEVDIKFGTSRYRFVEWGAWNFALIAVGPSGKKISIETSDPSNDSIPKEAYIASAQPRDIYDVGAMTIVQAGDFTGDGVIDLLMSYQSKEAQGLVLWLSDPVSKRHSEPVTSPTAYFDCG
jgi:hypothetical protein